MKIKKILLFFLIFYNIFFNSPKVFAQLPLPIPPIMPPFPFFSSFFNQTQSPTPTPFTISPTPTPFNISPTPSPTYALFEDNNPDNFDPFSYFTGERNASDWGGNCGKIGQKCCGKLTSPNIESVANYASGIISGITDNILIKVITFPITTLINFAVNNLITPFANGLYKVLENFNKDIFPTATRGYCIQGYPSNLYNIDECTCVSSINLSAAQFCSNIKNNGEKNQCFNECMKDGQGVWTALGCFSSDLSVLIKEKVFGLGIGLAGTFAFFCIIYAAFQIQSSGGNAEKLKKAQELLTSCIMGLIVIIFSVFILKLIGVNILQLPRFQ